MTFVSGLSKAELRLSSSFLKEGDTLTTKVATTNVKPGTTLFWQISGAGIDSKDFSSGSLSGSGSVDRSGSFSFSHTLRKDLNTEGRESFTVLLFSDKSLSNAVAKA